MGHTIEQWTQRVSAILRDETGKDATPTQVETTGIRPAFTQYSIDRPRVLVEEVAGAGSPYLALPTGYLSGVTTLDRIEYPARLNPPSFLDGQAWQITRDPADVDVEKLLINQSPTALEHVRFWMSTSWPYPTSTATDDLVTDGAFEPVCHLAAHHVCVALAGNAARSRGGNLPTDFVNGTDRARLLLEAAKGYRQVYEDFIGFGSSSSGSGDDGGGSGAPAFGSFDLDPAGGSLFHGGRR